MVLTRREAKLAFTHVLDVVLGRGDGTPLKSSLIEEGIEDIFSLTSLDEIAIHGLKYKDINDNNALKSLRLSDRMLLKCFLHYIIHKDNEGDPINDSWTSITQESFDEFRVSPAYIAQRTPAAAISNTNVNRNASTATTVTTYSPADHFRRGIKRDPTLFPALKDEKFNDSWHHSFNNQA